MAVRVACASGFTPLSQTKLSPPASRPAITQRWTAAPPASSSPPRPWNSCSFHCRDPPAGNVRTDFATRRHSLRSTSSALALSAARRSPAIAAPRPWPSRPSLPPPAARPAPSFPRPLRLLAWSPAPGASTIIARKKIGWGGRIRTFTIHINSVVSYRLDHAPAVVAADLQPSKLGRLRLVGTAEGFSKIARPGWASTSQPNTKNLSLLLHCASIDRATWLLPGMREVHLRASI
jgi:hypothetical protein